MVSGGRPGMRPHLYLVSSSFPTSYTNSQLPPLVSLFFPPSLPPLSTLSPHLHSPTSWVPEQCAEPSHHHHHHLHPPSPPSRTAALHQLCRPGESGVEEWQERGGFQPSEEREDRRTGKRGTMAAPSVALKTWVILQTLCLALAQVVSAQRRMWCALMQEMWGDKGPQVRWGDRGFTLHVSGEIWSFVGGLWLKYEGVKPVVLFQEGTSQMVKLFCFFYCGVAIKSGQSGGF